MSGKLKRVWRRFEDRAVAEVFAQEESDNRGNMVFVYHSKAKGHRKRFVVDMRPPIEVKGAVFLGGYDHGAHFDYYEDMKRVWRVLRPGVVRATVPRSG